MARRSFGPSGLSGEPPENPEIADPSGDERPFLLGVMSTTKPKTCGHRITRAFASLAILGMASWDLTLLLRILGA